MREAYRWDNRERFRYRDRRDAKALRGVDYSSERFKQVRKANKNGVRRRIMKRGYSSPSMLYAQGKTDEEGTVCPWCRKEIGYQDHIMWTCGRRPTEVRRPGRVLKAGLGWPNGDTNDEEVIAWMEQVPRKTWEDRYNRQGNEDKSGGEGDEGGEEEVDRKEEEESEEEEDVRRDKEGKGKGKSKGKGVEEGRRWKRGREEGEEEEGERGARRRRGRNSRREAEEEELEEEV